MAVKSNTSRGFRFVHVAQDALGYELICLRPEVHVDREGAVSPSSVAVFPFGREGRQRRQLPVNSDAGAQHYVFRVFGSAPPVPAVSVQSSVAVSANGGRFDLVSKSDVAVTKQGSTTYYSYAYTSVLATCYVSVKRDGIDGSNASVTSIAFIRSASQPVKPSGGTYTVPVPTAPSGWSDAPEQGTDPLWMSRARFTPEMTGAAGKPTPEWSAPAPVEDSSGIEFAFSASESDPGAPPDTHPFVEAPGGLWSKNPENAVWMAVAVKNCAVWEPWSYTRIKGEGGDPTPVISISPQVIALKKGQQKIVRVYVDVDMGLDRLDYGEYLCKSLYGVVTEGLRCFNVPEDGRFYYRFHYDGSTDINMDIPTFVQIGDASYDRVITVQTTADGQDGADGADGADGKDGKDGKDGADGHNGVWVPPVMLWKDYPSDYQFQAGKPENGDSKLDMVGVLNASNQVVPYSCKLTHVKGTNLSPEKDPNRWQVADAGVYKFLATELLWANVGQIDFFNSQAIRIGDQSGMCGYFGVPISGNGAILFLGGDSVSNATYVVYKDGKVTATNMHISGNSTFRGFVFHEKTEITAANYASMSTTVTYAPGESRSELDLMKSGNWIEFKSLPSGSGLSYTSLPAIRTGMANTDAYRDYVRQFLGNELYIYNSTNRSIAVDNGESSVEIQSGMACAFRMVLSPAVSQGVMLERIKWDYTGPFQF